MRNDLAKLFPLLVGVGLLAGCTIPSDPQLSVTGASVTQRDADSSVVVFTLRAVNENEEVLPLKRVNYSVQVGGRAVFTGERSPEVSIPGKGEQTFTIPAVIPGPAPAPGTPLMLTGDVTYISPGLLAEVLFDTGVRRPRAGFSGATPLDASGSASAAASAAPAAATGASPAAAPAR
jgi:hypothetical protein